MPRKFYGLDYDPEDEVVITSGGTEAITGAHDGDGRARATKWC